MKRLAVALAIIATLGMVAPAVVTAAPQDFVNVPDGQITETGVPDEPNAWLGLTGPELLDRSRGNTVASDNAGTLDVEWKVYNSKSGKYISDNAVNGVLNQQTPEDVDFPLKLHFLVSDDVAHEGREIAVPESVIVDLYGHKAGSAYGIHEDGTQWQSPISYEDGLAVFEVPKFSTNTITFSGTYTYTASDAADGAQFQYDVSDLDAADNFSIDVTGVVNSHTETVSAGSVSDGDTVNADIAGNVDPPSTTLTFEGNGFRRDDSASKTTVADSGTMSVDVDGNFAPLGPGGTGDPEVTFEGVGFARDDSSTATNLANGGTMSASVEGNYAPLGPGGSGDPEVTFTANGFSRDDSATASAVGSGGTVSASVDGNFAPVGPGGTGDPEVTFTGNGFKRDDTASATGVSNGGSMNVNVDGNFAPQGPTGTGDPEVTFTGNGFRRDDSASATSVSNGGTMSVDVDGNFDPLGPGGSGDPEVTFTGNGFRTWDNYSAAGVSPSGSDSISASGNMQPIGPGGGDPVIEVKGYSGSSDTWEGQDDGSQAVVDGSTNGEVKVADSNNPPPESINKISVGAGDFDSTLDVNLRIVAGEGADGSYGEGTLVASNVNLGGTGGVVTLDSTYDVPDGTTDLTVEFISAGGSGSWFLDRDYTSSGRYNGLSSIGGSVSDMRRNATVLMETSSVSVSSDDGQSYTFGDFSGGENKTGTLDLSTSATSLSWSGSGKIDWTLKKKDRKGVENPSVDVDGDGTDEGSHTGVLWDGETATVTVPSLSPGDNSWTVSSLKGSPDVSASWYERKGTEDPGIDVDSDGTDEWSHTGILWGGDTTTVTTTDLSTGDNSWDISTTKGNVDIDAAWYERKGTEDPGIDVDGDGTDEWSHTGVLWNGDTATDTTTDLSVGDNSWDVSTLKGNVDVSASWRERKGAKDPALDVDGDGNGEFVHAGDLLDGQTATVTSSDLSVGDNSWTVSTSSGNVDVNAQWHERKGVEDPAIDVDGDGTNEFSHTGSLFGGDTVTKTSSGLSTGDNSWSVSAAKGEVNITAAWYERKGAENPGIDLDGDGKDEASHTGILWNGDTASVSISPSLSDDNWDISAARGDVDVSASVTERTTTEDPSVEINGNPTSYTGKISDGTTKSLSTDTAWLQSGTNKINISVGDGTLTADAPSPSAGIVYQHDIQDDVSVEYTDEQFRSVYAVSRTYSSDRTGATMTIPMSENIASIETVEYRIDESGGWSDVSSSAYSMTSGNDLTVDISEIYGGEIPATTTMEINATGFKIKVNNGSVTVDSGSLAGDDVATDLTIDTWNDDSYISVSGTESNADIHHTTGESWSGADEHTVIEADGDQRVYLPGASSGATATVETIPVKATPDTGQVEISVDTTDDAEPQFSVAPGPNGGDIVSFTFVNAKDGQYYELYSVTNEKVRDSGTAQSPLTLGDDDSDEVLKFREAVQGGGGGSGGGGGIPAPSGEEAAGFLQSILPFAALGVGIVAFVFVVRRELDDEPSGATTSSSSSGSGGGIVGTITGAISTILVSIADAIVFVGKNARTALSSTLARLGLGAAAIFALFYFDAIQLSTQERTLVLLLGGLLGAYVVLKRIGRFDWRLFGVLSVAGLVVALNVTGSDLLGQIVNSPIFPVVGIGAIYLGWRALKAYRAGQETTIQVIGRSD